MNIEKQIAPPQASSNAQCGFTLTELMIASVVLLVGIVAVAQLVPASVMTNAANRNDSSAMVFAQSELDQMTRQDLNANPSSFTDTHGFVCNLGDPTQPSGTVVGSAVVLDFANRPIIDFSQAQVAGYSFNYQDLNDPSGTIYDVRWAVITTVNNAAVSSKRFILGVSKRGGNAFYLPVTLDTMVER